MLARRCGRGWSTGPNGDRPAHLGVDVLHPEPVAGAEERGAARGRLVRQSELGLPTHHHRHRAGVIDGDHLGQRRAALVLLQIERDGRHLLERSSRVAARTHRAVAAHQEEASAEVARVARQRVDLRRCEVTRANVAEDHEIVAGEARPRRPARRRVERWATRKPLVAERLRHRRALARVPSSTSASDAPRTRTNALAGVVLRRRVGPRIERGDGDVVAMEARVVGAISRRRRTSSPAAMRARAVERLAVARDADLDVGRDGARRDDANVDRLAAVGPRRRAHRDDADVAPRASARGRPRRPGRRPRRRPRRRRESVAARLDSVRDENHASGAVRGDLGERAPDRGFDVRAVASDLDLLRRRELRARARRVLGRGLDPKTTVPMRSPSRILFSASAICSAAIREAAPGTRSIDRDRSTATRTVR